MDVQPLDYRPPDRAHLPRWLRYTLLLMIALAATAFALWVRYLALKLGFFH